MTACLPELILALAATNLKRMPGTGLILDQSSEHYRDTLIIFFLEQVFFELTRAHKY